MSRLRWPAQATWTMAVAHDSPTLVLSVWGEVPRRTGQGGPKTVSSRCAKPIKNGDLWQPQRDVHKNARGDAATLWA